MRRSPVSMVASVAVFALTGCSVTSVLTRKPTVDYTAWSAGRSTPRADPIYPEHGNPGLDVLHYGLDLSWVPETKTLTGTATLRIRAAADLTNVRLDLSSAYQLDAVTVDGRTVAGASAGDTLTVDRAMAKDTYATLVVGYHGTPATVPAPTRRTDLRTLGLTVTRDRSLWTMQEPFGAFTWYPVNDHPSDKALYDIAVTVPPGWSAVANGTPTTANSSARPGTTNGGTFRYRATDPVASYLTTLAVGRYQRETVSGPRGLPVTYWFQPGRDDRMMTVVRRSPEYLSWLEARFGPYPFPSAGVVLVESRSAMETQQMVTMGVLRGNTTAQLSRADSDLLHEFAHHWFGDTVSPTNWQDLWLNEGWATYVQLLYETDRDQAPPYTLDSLRAMDQRYRTESGPPGHPRADDYGARHVYFCVALMLRTIHGKIGDAAFFALARDWSGRHRNGNSDRAGFIAFVNQHTGTDFTGLINEWLDSPTTPA